MISTILLSGGVGSRSGKNSPKQYCDLLGKKIICYCIDVLLEAKLTDELIIVYGDGFLDLIKNILKPYSDVLMNVKLVLGGNTRQESVFNGLKLCSYPTVVLHESARPLITSDDLSGIINHPSRNVTMGVDIPYTVLKQQNGKIESILDRKELFNVQLPQKFDKNQLLESHLKAIAEHKVFTDDSSLLFAYNGEVSVLYGSHENIKITTPQDFLVAEEILNNRNNR